MAASPEDVERENTTAATKAQAGEEYFAASDAYQKALAAEVIVNGVVNMERLSEINGGINVPPHLQALEDKRDALFKIFNKVNGIGSTPTPDARPKQKFPPAKGQGRKSRKRKSSKRKTKSRKSRR
jgi:hypothetical protein